MVKMLEWTPLSKNLDDNLLYYKDSKCELQLEKKDGVFWVGDKIRGNFTIKDNVEINVFEIVMSLEGSVDLNWEENVVENQNGIAVPNNVKFNGNDVISHLLTPIESAHTIPLSGMSYAFEIQIPPEAVPSCDVKHGTIKYKLSAKYREKLDDQLQSFFVVPVNIRKSIVWPVELLKPTVHELTKYAWSWLPCRPKPITAVVNLESSVYAPGDTIKYELTMIEPATLKSIQRLTIDLIQVQYMQASKPQKKLRREYFCIESSVIENELYSESDKLFKGSIPIPANIPTTCLDKCILQISYKLQISLAVFGGIGVDSTIACPLIICYDKLKLPISVPVDHTFKENPITNETASPLEEIV